jgi:hypothetical protein
MKYPLTYSNKCCFDFDSVLTATVEDGKIATNSLSQELLESWGLDLVSQLLPDGALLVRRQTREMEGH